jgi:hypothetical protein
MILSALVVLRIYFSWSKEHARPSAVRLPSINRSSAAPRVPAPHSKVQSRVSQPPSTVPHPNTVPVQRLALADRAPPPPSSCSSTGTAQRFQLVSRRPAEMMRRCSIAALAIFLLLLVCSSSSSNCAAAARLLPGAGHLRPLRHAAVGASGDELSAGSEVTTQDVRH